MSEKTPVKAAAIFKHFGLPSKAKAYELHKEAARARAAESSVSGRDIAPLPEIINQTRRDKCEKSLAEFCRTYFPETFYLEWSPDHLRIISKIETAVMIGGKFALAMPRGQGKTTICERAAIWATLYGYRKYIVLIGAAEEPAKNIMKSIKQELEMNDLLYEDFPEVCYPIRKLEGINNRASGQLLNGERTLINWKDTEIAFATIAGMPASGAVIQTAGITGQIRGRKAKINNLDTRPDMVLIDDPQTRESAESAIQNEQRIRILKGDILPLSGPGKEIAAVMPCTVIAPDDMAEQVLDTQRNPEWNGERLKLLVKFPKNMDLWKRYREISAESFRMHGDNRDATSFYKNHQAEMDEGAINSWPQRFGPQEISGIQYAMNLFFSSPNEFYAEYQNEPKPEDESTIERITAEQVLARLNHRKQATVPIQATRIIMFIDVQKDLLYFTVCAFAENMTCWVIDYGAFPDQKKRDFTLRDANPTYGSLFPKAGLEGAIYNAIHALTDDYLAREYIRDDSTPMQIERCIIDSGWGLSTESVYRACRESLHAAVLLPSKGVGITAAQKPITEYKKNQGDRIGFNWWIPSARKKRSSRLLEYDTNFWKSFFRQRLFTAMGDPGSFSLWGSNEETHRMIAKHLSSETSTPTAGRGRKVDIWKMTPNKENHLLDCVVGCYVGASLGGCELDKPAPRQTRPKAQNHLQQQSHHRIHQLGRVHTLNEG